LFPQRLCPGVDKQHLESSGILLPFLLAEDDGHHETDEYGEEYCADNPGEADVITEKSGGVDDGKDVDSRAGLEESRRRANAGAV
jgi:hypothetical protein